MYSYAVAHITTQLSDSVEVSDQSVSCVSCVYVCVLSPCVCARERERERERECADIFLPRLKTPRAQTTYSSVSDVIKMSSDT